MGSLCVIKQNKILKHISDIAKILLKLALNTNRAINQSINKAINKDNYTR